MIRKEVTAVRQGPAAAPGRLASSALASVAGAKFTQRRSAASTARLLQAAAELVSERGYEHSTLIAIGERAGYSRGLVTRRFGSKERLLEALLAEFARDWVRFFAALRNDSDGLRSILDAICRRNQENPVAMRGLLRLIFEASGSKPGALLRDRCHLLVNEFFEMYVFAIKRGIKAGIYRADLDPRKIASLTEFMVRGVSYHLLLDDTLELGQAMSILDDALTEVVRMKPDTYRAIGAAECGNPGRAL